MSKACLDHYQGTLSPNLSTKMPELTTTWCLILQPMQTNTLVDHGGFPLWAAIYWSGSSLCTPTVCYMVNLLLFTTVCMHSHPVACCFSFLLVPVLWTIIKCASLVIFLVASLAVSWWNNWWLCSCCGPRSDVLDETPVNRHASDPSPPIWGVCVFIIGWCGIGEEDDYKKKWEVLRTI